jgi:hypothetical protein
VTEENNVALVRRPPSALEKAEPGAKRILSGMVADALALADKKQTVALAAKFRIADYDWCEPDYRQILIWAKACSLRPEEVIERLLRGPGGTNDRWWETRFENGMLLKISWDFELLPLYDFQWVDGLETTHLFIYSQPYMAILPDGWARKRLPLKLPQLTHLDCPHVGLRELDLSGCPQLRALGCSWNWISQLDLASVPNLTVLDCGANDIEELDVSPVPRLTALYCRLNGLCRQVKGLRRLTMPRLPGLRSLSCSSNRLSSLDLSGLPNLTFLECCTNEIRELDLSAVPLLEELYCHSNPIRSLDIRPLHNLRCCSWKVPSGESWERSLIQRPDQHF